jgi:hypothetical protein
MISPTNAVNSARAITRGLARLMNWGSRSSQPNREASRRRDTEIAMLCMLGSLKQKVAMLKPLSPNGWASRPSQ